MWERIGYDVKWNTLYFAHYTDERVLISAGGEDRYEQPNGNINGCAATFSYRWYSKEGSNEILRVDNGPFAHLTPVLPYDAVRLRTTARAWDGHGWQTSLLVAEGLKGGERELFPVKRQSLLQKPYVRPLCVLPIQAGYIDFIQTGEHTGQLLCEESRVLLPHWPASRLLLYAELEWGEEGGQAEIVRSISVDYSRPEPTLLCDPPLGIPLFGSYLRERPIPKSFVTQRYSNAGLVAYYAEEIRSVLIGNPADGTICRIVPLPSGLANSAFGYYFDDSQYCSGEDLRWTSSLTIVSNAKNVSVHLCDIAHTSESAVETLSRTSKKILAQNIRLSELPAKSREKYVRILRHAMKSCTPTADRQVTLPVPLPAPIRSKQVTLTVQTPVSGMVSLDRSWPLGYVNCAEKTEKTFTFFVSEERFTIQFQAESFTKEIVLWRPFDGRTLQVDMSVYLRDDEIAQCRVRAAAEKRLQRSPADPYAIYQLGRAGSEGDLNRLLGLLEDGFVSSDWVDETEGQRIWNLVNAVFHLSIKYRRSDAIPLLRTIAEASKWGAHARTVQRINCCLGFLKSQKAFHSYRYRVDLLIRTRLAAQIYLDSMDGLLAETDGASGSGDGTRWCYVRTNKLRFSLLFKTAYWEDEIPIYVQNNDAHSRQEINVKPPVFTREMAKKVLAERGDGVLAIPDGFEVLADDFAHLLEQTDPEHEAGTLFDEIRIPASVTVVGTLDFADAPESLHDSSFEEIIAAEENPAFCSIDGVLFTKDRKKLICYPCGKQGMDYTVPDGVEVLGEHSFMGNPFLEQVCLPPSVKGIERQAFWGCGNLEQVTLPEGLEVLGESAFERCSIHHLTLPRSLRKIHWTNLSGGFGAVWNLEIPDAPIGIDMAGYPKDAEESYAPPLFLLNGKNSAFDRYARRHKRNLIRDFTVDEEGIVWADNGATLVEFPLYWPDDVYRVPDNVTGVFRWAFNGCAVNRVVASRALKILGKTDEQDDSRLDSKNNAQFDPDFLVTEEPTAKQPTEKRESKPAGTGDVSVSPAGHTTGGNEVMESLDELHRKLDKVMETGEDTHRKVTSLVGFVKTDLQTWLANQRPGVDDDELIEQFAQKAAKHINTNIRASDREVGEASAYLQRIFGGTWDRLLPETQSSLISAGVLWNLCTDITTARFDYSGIVIAASSALESELKRVFYTDFQRYMVEQYGDPTQQAPDKTYKVWPEKLLSCPKRKYHQAKAKDPALQLSPGDHFTLGMLPHLFPDPERDDKQQKLLDSRMREYLSTIVREKYRRDPVKAFADQDDADNFVQQCENLRKRYRNPAGHTAVLDKESAEKCYTMVVGVEKMEAFQYTHEVEGLIMILYDYLK